MVLLGACLVVAMKLLGVARVLLGGCSVLLWRCEVVARWLLWCC